MSRLLSSARAVIDAIDISGVAPQRIGRLVAHEGLMLEAEGFSHPLGTSARVMASDRKSVV